MKVYRKLPGASVDPIMQKQMVRGIHASLCGNGKVPHKRNAPSDILC